MYIRGVRDDGRIDYDCLWPLCSFVPFQLIVGLVLRCERRRLQ